MSTEQILAVISLISLAIAAILGISGLVVIFRSHVPPSEAAGDDLMAVAEAVREQVDEGTPVTGQLAGVHYACYDAWYDDGEPCERCSRLLPRRAAS